MMKPKITKILIPFAMIALLAGSPLKASASGREGPENPPSNQSIQIKTGASQFGNYTEASYDKKIKNIKGVNISAGAGLLVQDAKISQAARAIIKAEKKFDWNGHKFNIGVRFVPELLDNQGKSVKPTVEQDIGAKIPINLSTSYNNPFNKARFFIHAINLSGEPTEQGRVTRMGIEFNSASPSQPNATLYFEKNANGTALKELLEGKIGKIKNIEVIGKAGVSIFPDATAAPIAGVEIKGVKLSGEKGDLMLYYEGGMPSKAGRGKELILSFGLRE